MKADNTLEWIPDHKNALIQTLRDAEKSFEISTSQSPLWKILSDKWKSLGLRLDGPFDMKLLQIARNFLAEVDIRSSHIAHCNVKPESSSEVPDCNEMISEKSFFVDKTLFIKQFMESNRLVSAILRPKGFGKSWNLSMLKSFLSVHERNYEYFSKLKIGMYNDFMMEHCGKYPVILLNLQNCKGDNWDEMLQSLWSILCNLISDLRKDLAGYDIPFIDTTTFKKEQSPSYIHVLKAIMSKLEEVHGKKPIVLIDDFDAPVYHAFLNNYHERAATYFTDFFSAALKKEGALERACLVGIFMTSGSRIFSGFNNVSLFGPSHAMFREYFGCIETEISNIETTKPLEMIRTWYKGYCFGNSAEMIHTNSLVNYMLKDKFSVYCQNSLSDSEILKLFEKHMPLVVSALIVLTSGDEIQVPKLHLTINWNLQELSDVLHYLVLAGYLVYSEDRNTRGQIGHVYIPNYEMMLFWDSKLVLLFKAALVQAKTQLNPCCEKLKICFPAFDVPSIEDAIQKLMARCSSHSLIPRIARKNRGHSTENSCLIFYLACFRFTFSNEDVTIASSTEDENVVFDIRIDFVKSNKVVIFEFKRSSSSQNLDRDAKEAHEQVLQRSNLVKFSKGVQVLSVGLATYQNQISGLVTSLIDL
jgi:Predicted AAA-ATPase